MRKVIQTDILYFSIWKIICYLQWLLFRSGKLIGKLFSVSFFCITLTPCIILVLSWISMPLTKFKVMVVVQSLSCVWLFVIPWTAAYQASLSITNSWSLPKSMCTESVMPSSHLILCRPLLLLPSVFPSIKVFPNQSVLHIRWPEYWSFSFSISPSNEYSGLISFRMDWFDLLAVQGTLKSLLQHHSSKASILWHLDFFRIQLTSIYDY